MELVYGTAVAVEGRAVLLRGPSGSGKSDLALRLIENGAQLVADDQTRLVRESGRLVASAPDTIAGQLEVRGVGIVPVDNVRRAPLDLVIDMVPPEQVERYPEAGSCTYLEITVPLLALSPFEASTPAKVRLALRHLTAR
ncbi:HPr kinase/phosphatase C-terminal domain-containing protein [Nisaea acidiphila]|uniref:HPr kinase/phosphatase C-terminal domain-containing protein n=1 Tax=Nisaea acidiphila TaxID=1862145 RepID=A0A9J7B013_9PROT|nr:HPr kinase/phosphatase C-terminal domain-containing protein [Nisaea acidiphila]UUX51828.1 HPr kinase/phosphatase C-terminal domain-containing protein [Nisaea acidiphila]